MKSDTRNISTLKWSFNRYMTGSHFTATPSDHYTILLFLSGEGVLEAPDLGNIHVGKRDSVLLPSRTLWTLHTKECCDISCMHFGEFEHPYCKAYLRRLANISREIDYTFTPLHMCEAMVDFAEYIRLYVNKELYLDVMREYDLFSMLNVYYRPREIAGFLYPYLHEIAQVTNTEPTPYN